MKLLKHAIALGVILIASSIISCGKTPLLTDVGTSKLIIVIKGTYESNSPMNWAIPPVTEEVANPTPPPAMIPAYTAEHKALVQDDSVVHCTDPLDSNPNGVMLDIAEIKLADSKGHQFKLSNYRQTLSFGLNDVDPFFNGIGTVIDSDDVPSNIYPVVGIYIRKMLTDSASTYHAGSTGWDSNTTWDVFGEKEYPVFNFNKFQYHSYYDKLRYEASYINRVFPLLVRINDPLTQGVGMYFSMKNEVTVLEIRLVVKNFLKKYEYLSNTSDHFTVVHYYALSDWLQDIMYDEKVIGGNILTVARSYIVGMTGNIRGSNLRTHGAHVIAIPEGDDINDYTIEVPGDSVNWAVNPPILPPSRRSINPCNMPRGVSQYTGSSIVQALEYYLRVEKKKYEWNRRIWAPVFSGDPPVITGYRCPATNTDYPVGDCCGSFDEYKAEWNAYSNDVGGARVPQLAVYARSGDTVAADGNFTIHNITPGRYKLYIAQRAPVYGVLYYSYANPAHPTFGACDFTPYSGNPVTVTVGGSHDSLGNTVMVFPHE